MQNEIRWFISLQAKVYGGPEAKPTLHDFFETSLLGPKEYVEENENTFLTLTAAVEGRLERLHSYCQARGDLFMHVQRIYSATLLVAESKSANGPYRHYDGLPRPVLHYTDKELTLPVYDYEGGVRIVHTYIPNEPEVTGYMVQIQDWTTREWHASLMIPDLYHSLAGIMTQVREIFGNDVRQGVAEAIQKGMERSPPQAVNDHITDHELTKEEFAEMSRTPHTFVRLTLYGEQFICDMEHTEARAKALISQISEDSDMMPGFQSLEYFVEGALMETHSEADKIIVSNLRFKFGKQISHIKNSRLAQYYGEFAVSDMFGDNDKRFLEFVALRLAEEAAEVSVELKRDAGSSSTH